MKSYLTFFSVLKFLLIFTPIIGLAFSMEDKTPPEIPTKFSQLSVPQAFHFFPKDVFKTIMCLLEPKDFPCLFSSSLGLHNWGYEEYYPFVKRELDFSWHGLLFSYRPDQIRFNQFIMATLSVFNHSQCVINHSIEVEDEIPSNNYDYISPYNGVFLIHDKVVYFCDGILRIVQKAQTAYEERILQAHDHSVVVPVKTHIFFDLIPWIAEYARGNVTVNQTYKHTEGRGEDHTTVPNIIMSDKAKIHLKRYIFSIRDLLNHPNPIYAAEYALHISVMGTLTAFAGYGERQGYYRFYEGQKRYPNSLPSICNGTTTWLAEPALKNLFKNDLKKYGKLKKNKWLYLRYAEECMDLELAKTTLDLFLPEDYRQLTVEKEELLLKTYFALGKYEDLIMQASMSAVLEAFHKSAGSPYVSKHLVIWALMALGHQQKAVLKMQEFEQMMTVSLTQTYEYARCLMNFEGYQRAISLLNPYVNTCLADTDEEAYYIWCHKEINNLAKELCLKEAFFKKHHESVLAYYYAHFERDKLGYTGQLKKI